MTPPVCVLCTPYALAFTAPLDDRGAYARLTAVEPTHTCDLGDVLAAVDEAAEQGRIVVWVLGGLYRTEYLVATLEAAGILWREREAADAENIGATLDKLARLLGGEAEEVFRELAYPLRLAATAGGLVVRDDAGVAALSACAAAPGDEGAPVVATRPLLRVVKDGAP